MTTTIEGSLTEHGCRNVVLKLVANIAAYATRKLKRLDSGEDLLGEEMIRQPELKIDTFECIHLAFERRAQEDPQKIALIDGDRRLSRSELNISANRVSFELIKAGIGVRTRVGLFLERSITAAVGVLGILKSRAALIPL
jgi:non-ribosomal peptide synthetase component F